MFLEEEPRTEIQRLVEQAVSWKRESRILLDMIGIQPGWRCADLGCGPMGILDLLSERCSPSGVVAGVDLNENFILEAKEMIVRRRLLNARVTQANLFDIPFESGAFHLSHARFVFSEVGCDSTLLGNMLRITRPGGVIVSQESDLATWQCYPRNEGCRKLKNSLVDYFQTVGRDINSGLRTYQMFQKSRVKDIQVRTTQLDIPVSHPYRAGLISFIKSIREEILSSGVIKKEELENAIHDCSTVVNNPEIEIKSYTLYQVWGVV